MTKTLFFCDIDNTLCFTEENDNNPANKLISLERNSIWNNNKPSKMSFIAFQKMAEMLKLNGLGFIPTTMRSSYHYEISALYQLCDTAIIAGGAVILENGIPNEEWDLIVEEKYRYPDTFYDEVFRILRQYGDLLYIKDYGLSDNVFFEVPLQEGVSEPDLRKMEEEIRNALDLSLWDMHLSLVGNRFYVTPKIGREGNYSKELAIEFLQSKENEPCKVIAAGDSYFDKGMLELADVALVPEGSPVLKEIKHLSTLEIVGCGTVGTAEMLHRVLDLWTRWNKAEQP